MSIVILACEATPLGVPVAFTAWGVMLWFTEGRTMWRNPTDEIRKMAEIRAKSRIVHPRGRGDADQEFDRLWSSRWIAPVVAIGYSAGVIGLWITALAC
jgi:hypothetical protein